MIAEFEKYLAEEKEIYKNLHTAWQEAFEDDYSRFFEHDYPQYAYDYDAGEIFALPFYHIAKRRYFEVRPTVSEEITIMCIEDNEFQGAGNMVVAFIWLENGKINCEMKAYWEN